MSTPKDPVNVTRDPRTRVAFKRTTRRELETLWNKTNFNNERILFRLPQILYDQATLLRPDFLYKVTITVTVNRQLVSVLADVTRTFIVCLFVLCFSF